MPDYSLESALKSPVAGIDEVGYGAWAGSVVTAAVILDVERLPSSLLTALDDSKKLSKNQRESLYQALYYHQSRSCWIGVGEASPQEIDTLNVRQATFKAMERAIVRLACENRPASILVDGIHLPSLPYEMRSVIQGDCKSLSIAAASIIAKVTRDRQMVQLSQDFPQYSWEKNVGYGTRAHQQALEKYGVTSHHRQTYKPIQALLAKVA